MRQLLGIALAVLMTAGAVAQDGPAKAGHYDLQPDLRSVRLQPDFAGQVQPPAAPQKPATTTPAAAAAEPVVCPAPVPPATAPARAFTTRRAVWLHQVAPTRVKEFELLIAYLREALAKTTNPARQAQARGWEIFRVAEPGPNGDVLYAFLLDPAVPCVDYALGPILAEAYPDPAQLNEVWKLYEGSVRTGGSLMNLVPMPVTPAPPILAPPTTPATVPGSTPSTTEKPAAPTAKP